MTRLAIAAMVLMGLAACEPQVPDSAAGVGFGDYSEYQRQQQQARAARDAQLAASTTVLPPEATGAPTAAGAPSGGVSSADLAAAGIGAAPNTQLITPAAGAPLAATAAGAAYVSGANTTASSQQTFQGGQQPEVRSATVSPTAVPQRPGDTGPDIVAYALQTTNRVGQQVYSRGMTNESRSARKCGKYVSSEMAQRAFLESGGPQRDKLGLDPDGDGFACQWNPEPFRRAVSQ
ncbi:hypothetical protein CLV78_10495 [Aliiruegeria haliotis]|uniref:Excalibur calcium-binding domain-containing protein n=1 Tax=Aliiruegeria haliotis TaxID=1280846 RepID=A0A2T0RQY6_9RHOB|nr:hypothetical protein [Aliiruegeria haliotis]PRY23604.1 hypothetical protein CLV78_10495 [Aliiruegeria haliotis]